MGPYVLEYYHQHVSVIYVSGSHCRWRKCFGLVVNKQNTVAYGLQNVLLVGPSQPVCGPGGCSGDPTTSRRPAVQ